MTPQPAFDDRQQWLQHADFLNTVHEQMLAVAYAKMRNKADALDVVQESWIRILVSLDMLRDPDKLMPWAKRIVHNTANNAIRRKAQYRTILREQASNLRPSHSGQSVDRLLENTELHAMIQSLPADTKAIMVYKYYYEWKDQDIADRLSLPVGTVKAKIHRTKKRLKRLLRPSHP